MVGKYTGILVGYREYATKEKKDENTGEVTPSKLVHAYSVFCTGGKRDAKTGLYSDECDVITVNEESQVLKKMEYGMPVECYGEMVNGKNGGFMKYSDISAVN